MKVEITHDILAKKVFAKLDAEKQELLEIKGLIESRCEQNSRLNRKEIKRITPFLEKIDLDDKQLKFIKNSRISNYRILAANLSFLIILITVFFWFRSIQKMNLRQEQEGFLSDYLVAKIENEEQKAVIKLRKYLEHPFSKKRTAPPFYLEMAHLYGNLGKLDSAKIAHQLAIDKSTNDTKKLYYQVKKAQFHMDIGEEAAAQELINSILGTSSENTKNQTPLDTKEKIAKLWFDMKEYEEAKAVYGKMLQPLPDKNYQLKIFTGRAQVFLNLNNSLRQAVNDHIRCLKLSDNPLALSLPTDTLFLNYPNKLPLILELKKASEQMTDLDSRQVKAALDQLLILIDPIKSIAIEKDSIPNYLFVFDRKDSIRFPIQGNQVSFIGNNRIDEYYQKNNSIKRVLAAVSPANLDAVNTLGGNLSFGAFQWNIHPGNSSGELPTLLRRIKEKDSITFQRYFELYHLDISEDTNDESGYLVLNGQKCDSSHLKVVFLTPEWAFVFWKAAQDSIVIQAELEQMEYRLKKILQTTVKGTAISTLVTSEYGVAVLLTYSLIRPGDIRERLAKAITAAEDNLTDENIIQEFITSWKDDTRNTNDIDSRIQKIRNRNLSKAHKSFIPQ